MEGAGMFDLVDLCPDVTQSWTLQDRREGGRRDVTGLGFVRTVGEAA
jgi:hypothetical protein